MAKLVFPSTSGADPTGSVDKVVNTLVEELEI